MPDRTALLVIDMLMGNFDRPTPVFGHDILVSKIARMIAAARSAGAPVVYVQHCGPEGAEDEPGTPGWQIHPSVAPIEGDVIVQKRYPDSFQHTSLQSELQSRQIQHVVLAGIQTEYCVDATCRRAYSLGYQVTLVRDAHSTWDSRHLKASQIIEHHNAVLGGWFAKLKCGGRVKFGGRPNNRNAATADE